MHLSKLWSSVCKSVRKYITYARTYSMHVLTHITPSFQSNLLKIVCVHLYTYSYLVIANGKCVWRLASFRWNRFCWRAWKYTVSKWQERAHWCRALWIGCTFRTELGSKWLWDGTIFVTYKSRRWLQQWFPSIYDGMDTELHPLLYWWTSSGSCEFRQWFLGAWKFPWWKHLGKCITIGTIRSIRMCH